MKNGNRFRPAEKIETLVRQAEDERQVLAVLGVREKRLEHRFEHPGVAACLPAGPAAGHTVLHLQQFRLEQKLLHGT